MKTKLFLLIAVAALALPVVGCGSKEEEPKVDVLTKEQQKAKGGPAAGQQAGGGPSASATE